MKIWVKKRKKDKKLNFEKISRELSLESLEPGMSFEILLMKSLMYFFGKSPMLTISMIVVKSFRKFGGIGIFSKG